MNLALTSVLTHETSFSRKAAMVRIEGTIDGISAMLFHPTCERQVRPEKRCETQQIWAETLCLSQWG